MSACVVMTKGRLVRCNNDALAGRECCRGCLKAMRDPSQRWMFEKSMLARHGVAGLLLQENTP